MPRLVLHDSTNGVRVRAVPTPRGSCARAVRARARSRAVRACVAVPNHVDAGVAGAGLPGRHF
jgi:hypothetical protein